MTSTTLGRPSRRNPSFSWGSSSSSSSSSSASFFPYDSPSPATPLRLTGIPFSWEQFPGIPKKKNTHKEPSSQHQLLPLPPPSGHSFRKSFRKDAASAGIRRSCNSGGDGSFHEDPFFAAFVECSKDDEAVIKASKLRSSGGLYGSCLNLRACQVAESVVYVPRSRTAY